MKIQLFLRVPPNQIVGCLKQSFEIVISLCCIDYMYVTNERQADCLVSCGSIKKGRLSDVCKSGNRIFLQYLFLPVDLNAISRISTWLIDVHVKYFGSIGPV